jgi:hypothetical protein
MPESVEVTALPGNEGTAGLLPGNLEHAMCARGAVVPLVKLSRLDLQRLGYHNSCLCEK